MKISLFRDGYFNLNSTETIDWDELIDLAGKPKIGSKDGDYYLRGFCDGPRCDKNMKSINLIIIDGDQLLTDGKSCCPPEPVHEILKHNNIKHVIYSSYSNNPDQGRYRWRLCVPCNDLKTQFDIKKGSFEIVRILHHAGLFIKNSSENSTLSQPWYIPRIPSAEANDGFYSNWHDGETYVMGQAFTKPVSSVESVSQLPAKLPAKLEDDKFTWESVLEGLSSGTAHTQLTAAAGWCIRTMRADWADSQLVEFLAALCRGCLADKEKLSRVLDDDCREIKQIVSSIRKKVVSDEDTWEVFTLVDAFKPRKKLQYVIRGLFPSSSLSIVYGAPGTLKSMLLADAMMHVAAGQKWLGREVIQSPVLWIDFDNGKRRTDERMEALARQLNLPIDTPFYYYSMPEPALDAGGSVDMAALERRINKYGAKFVAIDNLGLIAPNSDENSSGMVQVMGNLRKLAEKTGAAIVLVHHERKSQGATKGGRSGERLRGHSSIEASLDLAILVEREPNGSIITICSTKTRDMDVNMFGADFFFTHKTGTDELERCGFYASENIDTTSEWMLEQSILSVVGMMPDINQSDIVLGVKGLWKGGEKKVISMLSKLEKKDFFNIKTGLHNSKLYSIKIIE